MVEESTTPDLVELTRRAWEAGNRHELAAATSAYAPDAVYVTERFGRFEGLTAIRAYFEDWLGSFDDLVLDLEEVRDLGNGIVFAVQVMGGRHASSSAGLQLRNAAIHEFIDGLIVRSTSHVDVDEARAVAERLAKEGG